MRFAVGPQGDTIMLRIARPLLACALALANAPANAQAGATPATDPSTASDLHWPAQPPTVDDICRALEQGAAENALPVEFFARVIWQESRFDAHAVSPKGAAGIAQFMPATASGHGLADPFEPIEALRCSPARSRGQRTRPERRSRLPPVLVRGKCHQLWAIGQAAHEVRWQ
jgi:hypothetical protein